MTYPIHLAKRPISLIEVLIALILTVSILMTLTFFYRQVAVIGYEVDRVSAENFNKRYIETRLAEILPRAVSETDQKRDFLFFSVGDEGVSKSGSQSLIFMFDNRVSLDKAFSGHVLARLYVDAKGNLMIAYWPSPKRWDINASFPMKKELLMESVDSLSFEFYIAPKPKVKEQQDAGKKSEEGKGKPEDDSKKNANVGDEKKKVEPEPVGSWRRQAWLQDYQQLPVMVKIIVTLPKDPNPLVFIYPLANAKAHVIYE